VMQVTWKTWEHSSAISSSVRWFMLFWQMQHWGKSLFLAGHLLFHSERQLHPTHYTVVVDVHISTLLPVRQLSHHPGHAGAHTGVHPSNKHISTDLLAIYFCGVTKLRRGWIPMTYGKQLESLWISAVPGYITVTRITPFQ
jgi:hypothetical protein